MTGLPDFMPSIADAEAPSSTGLRRQANTSARSNSRTSITSSTSPRISTFLKPTSLQTVFNRATSAAEIAPSKRKWQRDRNLDEDAIDLLMAATHLFGLITPTVVMVTTALSRLCR